jgi:hypothetical protein
MADDLRERNPIRDQGDNPPEDGVRSDIGGTSESGGGPRSGGATGVAPGGQAVERADDRADGGGAAGAGEAPRDPLSDVEHPTADE